MSRQKKQETFGQCLTRVMTEKKVSSALLARRLQVTERTVARWRADETEPGFPVKQSIGFALGLGDDLGWLPADEELVA